MPDTSRDRLFREPSLQRRLIWVVAQDNQRAGSACHSLFHRGGVGQVSRNNLHIRAAHGQLFRTPHHDLEGLAHLHQRFGSSSAYSPCCAGQ